MEPPAITRHRRPFLAPVWLTVALALLVVGIIFAAFATLTSATTTTVVLVRHAEKQLGTIDDPPLSQEGELRAQRLAQMFGDANGRGRLDAIYVSDTRRAQQTAAALASRLDLMPIVVPSGDVGDTIERIEREHRGDTVLVVGHSNTVPQLVRGLSDIEVAPIPDDGYDNVYVVSVPSIGAASVLQIKY